MMNPLLEQFLSESRELIELSCDTFLTLEKQPRDTDTLNGLFRYVHTIKGGSGLFDIKPFTELVHVAEDSLSKARDGKLLIDADGIDVFLRVMDQLGVWLDELEQNDGLNDDASAISSQLIASIESTVNPDGAKAAASDTLAQEEAPVQRAPEAYYLEQAKLEHLPEAERLGLLQTLQEHDAQDAVLLVYRPDEQAFFTGQDPVNNWLQVPALAWQSMQYDAQHEDDKDLDPYLCQLYFAGVSLSDEASLRATLAYVEHSVDFITIPARTDVSDQQSVGVQCPSELVDIARGQLRLLRELNAAKHTLPAVQAAHGVLCGVQMQMGEVIEIPLPDLDVVEQAPEYLDALEGVIARLQQSSSAKPTVVEESTPAPASAEVLEEMSQMTTKSSEIRTIKVDQERLEHLVDLTGELIVAKNSMQHLSRRVENEYGIKALSRELKSEYAVLNRISESLQGVVMQIRMIPVSSIFQRFPRLVRDLSRKLDKRIDLIIEGEETEADKNIVEQLADPLIHLVRNSIDHGIESPAQRLAAGKPETGVIRLCARNVEDNVVIEIHVDGGGIDASVIRDKAVAKGIISAQEAAQLSDDAALHLIFEPGFSTCEQVTDLSGRGVGMDVVKSTVSRVGGTVDISSAPGEGSTITVSLPASITVSRVMMFEMAGQVYGIPVEHILETIKIGSERVRRIKQGEAYVLRDKLIPIYRMSRLLGVHSQLEGEELPVLNININGTTVGLAVDKLLEGVDVIVKPMEGVMARFPVYSGAAVLGNGRVLLVVNPKELQLCH